MNQYHHLKGKSKEQILEELGHQFNYYPSNIWSYVLVTKRWFSMKKVLFLFFENDIVSRVIIQKGYGKINS